MKTLKQTASLAAAMLIALTGTAQATPIEVTVTADNVYGIYTGTGTAASTFVGADNAWPSAETYNFNLPDDNFIYVVSYTDDAVAQGFLAQFTNHSNGNVFYSSDPQWEVTATGINKNTADPQPTLAELSTQIQLANAGTNPANGWVAPTVGPVNGATPWGPVAGISSAAHWTWYDSHKDTRTSTSYPVPFAGFNHDEYLIFRIAVAATPITPSVPEPESVALALVGLGLCGAVARKRLG